jgi:hypothetical protein
MAGLSIKGAVLVADHYERLKISRDAPLEVIRAAYRALAAKHHPDRHGQSEGANTDMAALNAAYEVLCDPQTRAAYDATLLEAPHVAPQRDAFEVPKAQARRPRASKAAPDAAPQSVFTEGAEVDWAALVSAKPQVNPWATRQRLIPLGLALLLSVVGAAVWWSHDAAQEQAAGRLLADQYKAANPTRDLAAEAMAKSNLMVASKDIPLEIQREAAALGASAPDIDQALVHRSAVAALRHPLDGDPLSLKQVAVLVDPLARPAAPQPTLAKP